MGTKEKNEKCLSNRENRKEREKPKTKKQIDKQRELAEKKNNGRV